MSAPGTVSPFSRRTGIVSSGFYEGAKKGDSPRSEGSYFCHGLLGPDQRRRAKRIFSGARQTGSKPCQGIH